RDFAVRGPLAHESIVFDLADRGLSNAAHELVVRAVVIDDKGNRSDVHGAFETSLSILPDHKGPLVTGVSPTPGVTLYRGSDIELSWRAVDESKLTQIKITPQGGSSTTLAASSRGESGKVTLRVPESGTQWSVDVMAIDEFGNASTKTFTFSLLRDEPPVVSIGMPAPGTRLAEGESYTLGANVTDDRELSSVAFFAERNGQTVELERLEGDALELALASGQYLSIKDHAPHRAEEGQLVSRVGVIAIDSAKQQKVEYADFELMDDIEPPIVHMVVPKKDFEIVDSGSFRIEVTGQDNYYVEGFTPTFRANSGTEIETKFVDLQQTEKEISITQPNPNSFGSAILKKRHLTELKGTISLVKLGLVPGQTYDFFVKAADRGVHHVMTEIVRVKIKADLDTTAPKIEFSNPSTGLVYEEQQLAIRVVISDNRKLASFSVAVDGLPSLSPARQSDKTDKNTVSVAFPLITIPPYNTNDDEANHFVITAMAEDAVGNKSHASLAVDIALDGPPLVRLVDPQPAKVVTRGSLAYQTLTVENDYASAQQPLYLLPLFTTLSGLGEGGQRTAVGHIDQYANKTLQKLYIELDYPEGKELLPGRVLLAGQPYLEAVDGKLRVWPAPDGTGFGNLTVDFGEDYRASYTVTVLHDGTCPVQTEVFNSDTGVPSDQISAPDVVQAQIDITIRDASGKEVDAFVDRVVIDNKGQLRVGSYKVGETSRSALGEALAYAFVNDSAGGATRLSMIAAPRLRTKESLGAYTHGSSVAVPVVQGTRGLSVLGYAVDRFSERKGGQATLAVLSERNVVADESAPRVSFVQPKPGLAVVPLQRLPIKVKVEEDSKRARTIRLLENGSRVVHELGGVFNADTFEFQYEVPRTAVAGPLTLTAIAEDPSGIESQTSIDLQVEPNSPPLIEYKWLDFEKLDKTFGRRIQSQARLDYGEFWMRSGEEYEFYMDLSDDEQIALFEVWEIDPIGQRVGDEPLIHQDWSSLCPSNQLRETDQKAAMVFNKTEPTQYEVTLVDSYGNTTRRAYLIHPLTNLSPEVRITSPADDQHIASGTYALAVGAVATDDRSLGSDNFEFFINGVPVKATFAAGVFASSMLGGQEAQNQAFDSMYDSIASQYSTELAEEYGRRNSPHAGFYSGHIDIPAGAYDQSESLELMAVITDASGVTNSHTIKLKIEPDRIKPTPLVLSPLPGASLIEASSFTLAYSAYDNVKVEEVELYTAYGAVTLTGERPRQPYGAPLITQRGIEARDFLPASNVNIDTPTFQQLVTLGTLTQIIATLPGLTGAQGARLFLWVKVVARDASGNEEAREVSFPINVDQRPVVDILSPTDGAPIVGGTSLAVNVQADDDVGIDHVRLTAQRGFSGKQIYKIYNVSLRRSPFQFIVPIPELDPEDWGNSRIELRVEAVDEYGVRFGDSDAHRAVETITIEVVEDQPPTVAIAVPKNDSDITEGSQLLVEITAVDDVGIASVTLSTSGLISGEQSLVDTSFPFEFLLEVPYGQAGTDLYLTASAAEQRLSAKGRVIRTPRSTRVRVVKDVEPPALVVRKPTALGATVYEKGNLEYAIDATDNVKVASIGLRLLADRNSDGVFSDDELYKTATLYRPPYGGGLSVGTMADILGKDPGARDTLPLRLEVTAQDGVPNKSVEQIPVALVRNLPPEIVQIQILDSRGFNIGMGAQEVTEGRGIVVNVVAKDRESGVDWVRLHSALGPADAAPSFSAFGKDEAAPFQFHFEVPAGHVGELISFKAEARDVDGYTSPKSGLRSLRIVADEPPVARIVKPDNDLSAVIVGQDIEVVVEAQDDLGFDGIDRVVFYMNDIPVATATEPMSTNDGLVAGDSLYSAMLTPPTGVTGVRVHAIAYDKLGQPGRTQTVLVGQVEDTVAPKLSLVSPIEGQILTQGEPLELVASVADVGLIEKRQVLAQIVRETQDASTGQWQTIIASEEIPLNYAEGKSDPKKDYYVYTGSIVDGTFLKREGHRNERVRILTQVVTPNHTARVESHHEVGLPIAERGYLLAKDVEGKEIPLTSLHYTAVDQFQSTDRTNALVGAWSSCNPMYFEPESNQTCQDAGENEFTAITLIDDEFIFRQDEQQRTFWYSDVVAGATDLFRGSIAELRADENYVLAAKAGDHLSGESSEQLAAAGSCQAAAKSEAGDVACEITRDPTAGKLHFENGEGELLIFTTQNKDANFGLPYVLSGRVDMPYKEVYGVARKDDLAFVANGLGGVQVVDLSDIEAPYRVSFIKPNGYARDVEILGHFAVIAASEEGLVVADIADPTMPIIATCDTFGTANRLFVEGDKVYVTDLVGDGGSSELNIIDVSNPYEPKLEKTLLIEPAQVDLVSDGVYDLFVSAGTAYVTVHYSSKVDHQPAQSVVEVIDLRKLDDPSVDATIPAVIHRKTQGSDFAPRGIMLARGGIQVAADKQGIARIELPSLRVLSHTPEADAQNVRTDLEEVSIELSANLPENTPLNEFVHVRELDGQMGLDVTSELFDVGFATRDGELSTRFIELRRKQGVELKPGLKYVVSLDKGLAPISGLPLPDTYEFSFLASKAGPAAAPIIDRLVPNRGTTAGNTPIVIYGQNFGDDPQVLLGGYELVVDSVVAGVPNRTGNDSLDKIYTHTVPSYPGPASVEVVSDNGLWDELFGGFTYVEDLFISFVNPAVVRVDQNGADDLVEVVGYGFHNKVQLRAWKSGDPLSAVRFTVDNQNLRLESPQKMHWRVPDFGDEYRGFVDVEVRDEHGARFIKPKALFYGHMTLARQIEEGSGSNNQDAMRLPSGLIRQAASDADLGLIYVLGAPYFLPKWTEKEPKYLDNVGRGWLSLVHYHRDALDEAAPMLGLGYYNMPPGIIPERMALGPQHVYVASWTEEYPYLNVPYENQRHVLVYDRADELPADGDTTTLNRDILYRVPLPLVHKPEAMAITNGLLFVGNREDGVAVLSLADPVRPFVVRVISQAIIAGAPGRLEARALWVIDSTLYVSSELGTVVMFDLRQPGLLQIGVSNIAGNSAALGQSGLVCMTRDANDLRLYDSSVPGALRLAGQYESLGRTIPGEGNGPFGTTTLAGTTALHKYLSGYPARGYLNLYDVGRPGDITLLDVAQFIPQSLSFQALSTTDGMVVAYSPEAVSLFDTLMVDLVSSEPRNGDDAVPTDSSIALRFTRTFGEDDPAQFEPYIELVRDNGTAQGVPVDFSLELSGAEPHTLVLVPESDLAASTEYRVVTHGEVDSRRTKGLFEYELSFTTGLNDSPLPGIDSVSPRLLETSGGKVEVLVHAAGPGQPSFAVGGIPVSIESREPKDNSDEERFLLRVPGNVPGPASLKITTTSGASDEMLGAIVYVDPLRITTLYPEQGSVNGGTLVTIKGGGFRTDGGVPEVLFGGIPAAEEGVRVVDGQTLFVTAPPGRLGHADVTVVLASGQSATLTEAFEYLQPSKLQFQGKGATTYQVLVDPTGQYLVVAAGDSGVLIYDIATDSGLPEESRLVAQVKPGFSVLGVDTYFEGGVDRVIATGYSGDEAKMAIIGFDSTDIARSSVIAMQTLPGNFARGVDATNGRAVLAMGTGGLGILDIFLPTKTYFVGSMVLPFEHSALDVEVVDVPASAPELYVVTSGQYQRGTNKLIDEDDPSTGAFYMIEHRPASGFEVIGSVAIPALRVELDGDTAFLAAGSQGLVLVDVSDPRRLEVISRLEGIGYIFDVSLVGNTAYLAAGERGILAVDVTDPHHPVLAPHKNETAGRAETTAVAGTSYGAVGAGDETPWNKVDEDSRIVVAPDTMLKVFAAEPQGHVLDEDANGDLKIRLRFNKVIDLWAPNLTRFALTGSDGSNVPFDVEIINNDALLTISSDHALAVGETVTAVAEAGIESVKPLANGQHLVLYTLAQDQEFTWTYRGSRQDALTLDAVTPRRVPVGIASEIQVAMRGAPENPNHIKVFVAGTEAVVYDLQATGSSGHGAIVTAVVPALSEPGQYDVSVAVWRDGVWEMATLRGALAVDEPLHFEHLSPSFGPVTGGTAITLRGRGFEPGNTVMDGIKVRIGSVPAASVKVLSTTEMVVISPPGLVGRNDVFGQDRYGYKSSLRGDAGFGYGLRRITTRSMPFSAADLHIDQETGVAVTNGGLVVHNALALKDKVEFEGFKIDDFLRAATIDVQEATDPLFVGGVPLLPSDPVGTAELRAYLHGLPSALNYGVDSMRLLPTVERENGVEHKRLYVASGFGGVATLNFDEQNGLQTIAQELQDERSFQVGDVAQAGDAIFAAGLRGVGSCSLARDCAECSAPPDRENNKALVHLVSSMVPADPVRGGFLTDASGNEFGGGNVVKLDGEWIYAGGGHATQLKNAPAKDCITRRPGSALSPKSGDWFPVLSALNLYDPAWTLNYGLLGNPIDVVSYGNYLVVAEGNMGVEIFDKKRPEQRAHVKLDTQLQANPGEAVRLKLLGNVLFIGADSGSVVVVDLTEPLSPRIVSAGNSEDMRSVDYYKGRLVGIAGNDVNVLELPGPVVARASTPEGGFIPENDDYLVELNEHVTVDSMKVQGNVTVSDAESGGEMAVEVEPRGVAGTSAQVMAIAFEREVGHEYEVRIKELRNLRSQRQWVPFVGHVVAASSGAMQPNIHEIKNGTWHLGDVVNTEIHGAGFRNSEDLAVIVDGYELDLQEWSRVDKDTIALHPHALESLPLEPGIHHLRVEDGELVAYFPGAFVIGDELDLAKFKMSRDSSPQTGGGARVEVTATLPVILPGTKVVMRSSRGKDVVEIRTLELSPGVFTHNLLEDVVTLQKLRFRLPGVPTPDIYDVFLEIGDDEVRVGAISYNMNDGRSIDLPNYPPMDAGAVALDGELLYVGVESLGGVTGGPNPFLMKSGLEIYDLSIWERPIRLSQIPTEQPVTGVVVKDGLAFLAAGSDGLVVVDVHDPVKPFILYNLPATGDVASDVALKEDRGVLAMSLLGSGTDGMIRFFDQRDPSGPPPLGFGTIVLSGELAGLPVDVEWLGDELYVLLLRAGTLHLAVIRGFGGALEHTVQAIERGTAPNRWSEASLVVQHGQVVVSNGATYFVLTQDASKTVYWKSGKDFRPLDLVGMGGVVFMFDGGKLVQMPTMGLAVAGIEPGFGATLVPGDTIRVELSGLFNTDEVLVYDAMELTDSNGNSLGAEDYALRPLNTLEGGIIAVQLSPDTTFRGDLRLRIGKGLVDLAGQSLLQAVEGQYQVVEGLRPRIDQVSRYTGSASGKRFFHADGSETGLIRGSGFGVFASDITVYVGDVMVPPEKVASVSDSEIWFTMPRIATSVPNASLSVSVVRGQIEDTLYGAVVIQPAVVLQAVDPGMGPPQGGNVVNLYGAGFSYNVVVRFGSRVAGGLVLRSAQHLQVRAPSGSMGLVDVSVENTLFPGEVATLSNGYFYANRETGSVNLSTDQHDSNPVTGIAIKDQILYAITGGGYDAIDRNGQLVRSLKATKGQLVVSDISDPVHPELVLDVLGKQTLPYHLEVPLPPSGFTSIVLNDDDLFLVGGNRLFLLDVTLPADPLLVQDLTLLDSNSKPDMASAIVAAKNIVFVSTRSSLRVLRMTSEGLLEETARIPSARLGGAPGGLTLSGSMLWVAVPDAGRVVGVDLAGGAFEVVNSVNVVGLAGQALRPEAVVVRDKLMLVSTGSSASVMAYQLRDGGQSEAASSFNLAHLQRISRLYASQMLILGQTLYVAAGQGDLQIYDISGWLNGDFTNAPQLENYFAVQGSIDSIAFGKGALYAGSAFLNARLENEQRVDLENPIDLSIHLDLKLGGALNTLKYDDLTIVEQAPLPQGKHPSSRAIEVQFNRVLDPDLVSRYGSSLFTVSLGGLLVPGTVASTNNHMGTRLFFRPMAKFAGGREYSVKLSGSISDIHGARLGADYRFRFVAVDALPPKIDSIAPTSGGWRGGNEVRILGDGFEVSSEVRFGAEVVPREDIDCPSPYELRVKAPALSSAPAQNLLVGISVSSGGLEDFVPAAYNYIADARILEAGQYFPETGQLRTADDSFLFNGGELAGLRGEGLTASTRVLVNGVPAQGLRPIDARTLVFQIPNRTVGKLSVAAFNAVDQSVSTTDELVVGFGMGPGALSTGSLMARSGELLVTVGSAQQNARLFFSKAGGAAVQLATMAFYRTPSRVALSDRFAAFWFNDDSFTAYDISNVYAPRLVGTFATPKNINATRLWLGGSTAYLFGKGRLFRADVRTQAWEELADASADAIVDVATDDQYLYLLRERTLDIRKLENWTSPLLRDENGQEVFLHALVTAKQITVSPQRIALIGQDQLQVLLSGALEARGRIEPLGLAVVNGVSAAKMNGELLAVAATPPGQPSWFALYDMAPDDNEDGELDWVKIADVHAGNVSPISQIEWTGDRLDWSESQKMGSADIPLLNLTNIEPGSRISQSRQPLMVSVQGDLETWQNATLALRDDNGLTISGQTHLDGAALAFEVAGSGWAAGRVYEVSLAAEPLTSIVGGEIQHDLGFALAMPWLSESEVSLRDLSPRRVIADRVTQFVLRGTGLAEVTSLSLNDISVPPESWTLGNNGQELRFPIALKPGQRL
ncbi:MAG: IPT/TIG domain-containing protein, partial [Myxococcota bacterium]|nr:IPT/TIG domain-containing protein [Myxococcota bacterium]